jgi:hypothetical protein
MQPLTLFLARLVVASSGVMIIACGPSQDLGPAITCSDVSVSNQSGECDLVANKQCSDGSFYEIDCGDDATCSCIENGSPASSIFASDQSSGFCASFDVSQFHDLAAKCGWNLNQ